MIKQTLLLTTFLCLAACAGTKVTKTQDLSTSADAPYENVLVVSLLSSFDLRRFFEADIVKQLTEQGIKATASTSMMNTKTPVNRQTFVDMVEKLGSDAVLVTQLVSIDAESKMKDMNPQATYNFRPTYYYNIWSVEQTEYVEPQSLEIKNTLMLATTVFSASSKEPVWAIQTQSKFTQNFDQRTGAAVIENEARAITRNLARDGLLAK